MFKEEEHASQKLKEVFSKSLIERSRESSRILNNTLVDFINSLNQGLMALCVTFCILFLLFFCGCIFDYIGLPLSTPFVWCS